MDGPSVLAKSELVCSALDGLVVPRPWVGAVRNLYLILVDLTTLVLCGVMAYLVWALPVHGQSVNLYLRLVPLLGFFILGYALFGLYPGLGIGGVELLRRLTLVTLFCFVFLAAVTFALKLPHLYSRMTFVLALASSLLALPWARYAALVLARRWRWWSVPMVLIAEPHEARQATAALVASRESDYHAVGILQARSAERSRDIVGVPVLGSVDLASAVAARGISIAVVVAEHSPRTEILDQLRRHFRHVMMIKSYAEVGVERLKVRNLGSTLAIEYANNLLVPHNKFLKRTMDIVVGIVGIIIAAPVIALSLAVTILSSPGPAMYYQERRGFRGKHFRMPKIRTMHRDAEAQLAEHLNADAALRSDWQSQFKLKDDPRIVPYVGSFLRRLSLDELPQLVSVVRGDMSLVGPRPLPEYHLEALSSRVRELRTEVRPGITGLWQVSGRSSSTIGEQEARDEYYIRNWTVWLDLYLMGKTVGAVISGRDAY